MGVDLTTLPTYRTFRSELRGVLVLPTQGETYTAALGRWSALAVKPAAGVVYVKDEGDIAASLKFAIAEKLDLAVTGGGHNSSGASSSLGGLVIDLSRYLTNVTVDVEKQTATVGGGARWADVDNATAPYGLAAVGGTVSDTGVGGLTVGGGYGFLSSRHGLVIDNLLKATVVLADGSVVTASKDENEDLFFAIRGGGINFGIVTTFEFALHPIPPTTWGGPIIFPPDRLDEVVEAVNAWAREGQTEDEALILGIVSSPAPPHDMVVLLLLVHFGAKDSGEKAFKELLDLNPVANMTSEMPYASLNKIISEPAGKAYYNAGATANFPLPPSSAHTILGHMQALRSELPSVQGGVLFELYHPAAMNKVPNDEMAFNARGQHRNAFILLNWVHGLAGENGGEQVQVQVAAGRRLAEVVRGLGTSNDRPYGNYQTETAGLDKARKVYGDNYPKLQRIKAKYDPDLVFSKWFPIQPDANA